jgi:hypothetical protein
VSAAKEGDIIPMSKRVGLSTETVAMTTERARCNDTADSGIDAPVSKSKGTNNGIAGLKRTPTSSGKEGDTTTSSRRGSVDEAQKNLGGRPRASNQAYIDAIKAEYPPGRLVEMMQEAFTMAVDTNSWRGMVAVMEFAANYSLGKPVKRVESTGDSSLADLLAGVDTSKPLMSGPTKADDDDQADD